MSFILLKKKEFTIRLRSHKLASGSDVTQNSPIILHTSFLCLDYFVMCLETREKPHYFTTQLRASTPLHYDA